jgi:hypothetical protein
MLELSPVGTIELSPGRQSWVHHETSLSPEGTVKVVQDGVAAYLQPSLRDWSSFKSNPGLSSWLSSAVPAGLSSRDEQ